jgi:hypothetical protein
MNFFANQIVASILFSMFLFHGGTTKLKTMGIGRSFKTSNTMNFTFPVDVLCIKIHQIVKTGT